MCEVQPMPIGVGLRILRALRGVTQYDLAMATGKTINFLSQVENGRKGVSQAVVEQIAEALEVPPSFLYVLSDLSNDPTVETLKGAIMQSLQKSREDAKVSSEETKKTGEVEVVLV